MINLKIFTTGFVTRCIFCVMLVLPASSYAQPASESDPITLEQPVTPDMEVDSGKPRQDSADDKLSLASPDVAEPAPSVAPEETTDAIKTPEDVAENPLGAVGGLVSAIRDGDFRWAAAIALSILMLLFAKARDRFEFFKGDRGGVISVLALSTAGALATSLFSSAPVDVTMFLRAGEIGVLAMGGFLGIKQLFWPADKALAKQASFPAIARDKE